MLQLYTREVKHMIIYTVGLVAASWNVEMFWSNHSLLKTYNVLGYIQLNLFVEVCAPSLVKTLG